MPLVDHLSTLTYVIHVFIFDVSAANCSNVQTSRWTILELGGDDPQKSTNSSGLLFSPESYAMTLVKQISEQAKISKEVHSCDTAFCLVLSFLDPDSASPWSPQPRLLSAYMFCTFLCEYCIQQSMSPLHLYHQCQGGAINTHQKTPVLLLPCCVVLLACTGEVQVLHEDWGL